MEQHREARGALDQRADRRTAETEDQVALPMARHGAVCGLRRARADHDLGRYEGFAPAAQARSRQAQRSSGAQACGEFALQRATALHVERLVDGLVADAHGLVLGEVEPESAGDLLRAPSLRPPSVLPAPGPPALPGHARPADLLAAWRGNPAGEPILHIVAQPRVHCQLRRLRTTGGPIRMPLRGRGPVLEAPASRGRVAAQLTRDRGGRPPEPAGDLPDAVPACAQKSNLLPLDERQVPPRRRLRRGRKM